ncbi:hypothetical protein DEJ49_30330 [Streptomyces venezuelae]|uniref:Uncharacterized protein n=1 Tax=Streptomyces venezuelae TaxID=54571 RepID=A0A5P2CSJ6_STRVZ|nr:hypothetical protein DEJ49_30330 [Streptomyces venezuelae]
MGRWGEDDDGAEGVGAAAVAVFGVMGEGWVGLESVDADAIFGGVECRPGSAARCSPGELSWRTTANHMTTETASAVNSVTPVAAKPFRKRRPEEFAERLRSVSSRPDGVHAGTSGRGSPPQAR